jgi:hypothetical protein
MEHFEFGEPETVSDVQAADDEAWLASLPAEVKTRADAAFSVLAPYAWQSYSCGNGAKGRWFHDWAWIGLGGHEWVLARRSTGDPDQVALHRCWSGQEGVLPEPVRVAGSRWSVEECFQATKNEDGLDYCQMCTHTAWYRYVTLVMMAHVHLAFLAIDYAKSAPWP